MDIQVICARVRSSRIATKNALRWGAMRMTNPRSQWRYRLGWGLIGAGYIIGRYYGKVLKEKYSIGWLGELLTIVGVLVIAGWGLSKLLTYVKTFDRDKALSTLLATLGTLLTVFALVVIVLDITSPEFTGAISTWHYALPLIGGIALIFFAPAIETFERISAKKTELRLIQLNKGGEEARASD
jgi:hypothetical protein